MENAAEKGLMPMSVCSHPVDCFAVDARFMLLPSRMNWGFTLVEILVVLAVIGLVAGVALPGLYRMARSIEVSGQRETLLTEINGLGYRAYVTGESFELGASRNDRQGASVYPFVLPHGWQLEIPQPIRYSFNGTCSGGRVTVVSPDQRREELKLEPPLCKVTGVTTSN